MLGAAGQLKDWVELKWFQYVIAYDAYDQQNALFLLRETLAPHLAAAGAFLSRPGGWALALVLALALAAGLGGLLARLLGRRPWRGGLVVAGAPAASPLSRLLSALARRGLIRRPDETPLELARRAQRQLGLPEAVAAWIPRYYAQRYGGRPLPAEHEAELEQVLAGLETRDDG